MESDVDNKKILLADDVELFLELQKTFLRRESFDIVTARTGLDAVELASTHRPDIIITDLHMPGMNGDEACRRIKADPELCGIPVIIVTSAGKPEEQEQCQKSGCDAVLLKPINRTQFLATVRSFLHVTERTTPRITARLRVRYGKDNNTVLSDYSLNISTGGLFLATDTALEENTPLSIEFTLPDRKTPVTCQGRVAWTNGPRMLRNPSLPPGVGIQFLDLKLDDMHAIRRYVEESSLTPSW